MFIAGFQDLVNNCREIAHRTHKNIDTACNAEDFYDHICEIDVVFHYFSIGWMICITAYFVLIENILLKLIAWRLKMEIRWGRGFKLSIFHQILKDSYPLWVQWLLYIAISLGYFYWIPLEYVLEAYFLNLSNLGLPLLSIGVLIGATCEFFYFWITFFIVLLLGTRWDYTILNRTDIVPKKDHAPMLKFMLQKSAVFSMIFFSARVILFALHNMPMVNTFNNPLPASIIFAIYHILLSAFILTYAVQRMLRYRNRLKKLVTSKTNQVIDDAVGFRLQKHKNDVLASTKQIVSIVKNTEVVGTEFREKYVESTKDNVNQYFLLHEEELKESIDIIVKEKAITMHRNPKETSILAGFYLTFTVVSNLIYLIAAISNEFCKLSNNSCNCKYTREVLEYTSVIIKILDSLIISKVIQMLLSYDCLFGDALEFDMH